MKKNRGQSYRAALGTDARSRSLPYLRDSIWQDVSTRCRKEEDCENLALLYERVVERNGRREPSSRTPGSLSFAEGARARARVERCRALRKAYRRIRCMYVPSPYPPPPEYLCEFMILPCGIFMPRRISVSLSRASDGKRRNGNAAWGSPARAGGYRRAHLLRTEKVPPSGTSKVHRYFYGCTIVFSRAQVQVARYT